MESLVLDTLEALAYAESAGTDRVFWALADRDVPRGLQSAKNVFGRSVVIERDGYADTLLLKARAAQESGERAVFITSVAQLSTLRREVLSISLARVGLVIHVLGDRGQVCGDALAFLDFGLGAVFSSRAQESVDLTWIARRASEDARTPFFVLHEVTQLRSAEVVFVPGPEAIAHYLGDRTPSKESVPASTVGIAALDLSERQYKERVPFALGAASREYETLVGRRHGLGMKTAGGNVVFAGLGSLGDIAEAAASVLQRRGYAADTVKLGLLRPYDGARVVKSMVRADVVIAVEWEATVLAQSGHLAREIKAAFADAITWTPGYPGISSVPRVVSCGCAGVEMETEHLVAAALYALEHKDVRALLLDELDLVPPRAAAAWADAVTVRAVVNHGGMGEGALDAVLAALAPAPGYFAHACVRRLGRSDGDAYALDVSMACSPRNPSAIPTAFDVIIVQNEALASAETMGRLARGGESVVLSSLDAREVSKDMIDAATRRGGSASIATPFELGSAEEGPLRIAAALVSSMQPLLSSRFLGFEAGEPTRTLLSTHADVVELLGKRVLLTNARAGKGNAR